MSHRRCGLGVMCRRCPRLCGRGICRGRGRRLAGCLGRAGRRGGCRCWCRRVLIGRIDERDTRLRVSVGGTSGTRSGVFGLRKRLAASWQRLRGYYEWAGARASLTVVNDVRIVNGYGMNRPSGSMRMRCARTHRKVAVQVNRHDEGDEPWQ